MKLWWISPENGSNIAFGDIAESVQHAQLHAPGMRTWHMHSDECCTRDLLSTRGVASHDWRWSHHELTSTDHCWLNCIVCSIDCTKACVYRQLCERHDSTPRCITIRTCISYYMWHIDAGHTCGHTHMWATICENNMCQHTDCVFKSQCWKLKCGTRPKNATMIDTHVCATDPAPPHLF